VLPLKIPQQMKNIIFGSTLGDLHISKRRDRGNVTANLIFRQSIIHKDYLYHLYNIFKYFCTNTMEPKIYKSSNDKYLTLNFCTRVSPIFNYYHDLFYINGKKVIPYGVEHLFTPEALAYWFKDDGTTDRSLNGKIIGFSFCTDSFSYSDVYYLSHILKYNYKLNCSIFSSKDNPRLYIKAESRKQLKKIITPYKHESMKYKLNNKLNNPKTKTNFRLKTKGVKLGIFDKNINLVSGPYITYQEAVNGTGISIGTIFKYKNLDKLFKDRCYILELDIDQLDVINFKHIIEPFNINLLEPNKKITSSYKNSLSIKILDIYYKEIKNSPFISLNEASKNLNIPLTTLRRYLNSGKLLKNKFYIISK
jgi:hypothetical protein